MARRDSTGGSDEWNPIGSGDNDRGPKGSGGGSGGGPIPDLHPKTLAQQGIPLPILYGTHKAPFLLIEVSQLGGGAPGFWGAAQRWSLNDYVQLADPSGGTANVWRCTQSGLGIDNWQPSHAYVGGDRVVNFDSTTSHALNEYICTSGGNSAAGGSGPQGTGININDNTAVWAYQAPAGPRPERVNDGAAAWAFVQKMPFTVYFSKIVAAVCEGEATGLGSWFWVDKERRAVEDSTHPGGQLTFLRGVDAETQVVPAPFSYSYQHTALVHTTASALGLMSGSQYEIPAMAVETKGQLFGASTPDVSPADIINDILTHTRRGCAWPGSRVDASITGSAAGAYRVYCDAAGLRMSMYIDTQRTALDIIAEILHATNSDAVWSGGALKVIPLGDQPIASPVYGATGYVPANTVQYALGVDDFLDFGQPVQITRRSDTDCFNAFSVEYIDRDMGYAKTTVENEDPTDVQTRGPRRGATQAFGLCFPDGLASVMLSRIYAQRSLNIRNTYTFRIPWRYIGLEPGDIVTLTEPSIGLVAMPVRLLSLEETEAGSEGGLTFTAEDYPAAVMAAGRFTPQAGTGLQPNVRSSDEQTPQNAVATSFTSPNFENLWPNPASESAAPERITVANDGSNPEYDYRVQSASAYAGNWVRELVGAADFRHSIPCSPGDAFLLEAQTKRTVGSGNHGTKIEFLDKNGTVLGGASTDTQSSASYVLSSTFATAPAGTIKARADLWVAASTTAHFDGISFRRMVTGPLVLAKAIGNAALSNNQFGNIFPNPTSEESPPPGPATAPEWVGRINAGGGAYAGSWVRQLSTSQHSPVFLGDALATPAASDQSTLGVFVPCSPGESFYMEAQCKMTTATAGEQAGVYMWFVDDAGAWLSGVTAETHRTAAATGWAKVSATGTAPAGSVKVLLGLYANCALGTVTAQFDAITARKMVSFSQLEADAIRTSNYAETTPTAWAASTAYAIGDLRSNGANSYRCRVAGTSAGSGGPTGTGSGIVDGGATWDWAFAGPYATAGAKLDKDGTALKVAASNALFGQIRLDSLLKGYSTTISGATSFSPAVVIDMQPDVNYVALIIGSTWSGTPPDGAFIVKAINKHAESLSFTVAGNPGVGNSVTYDVFVLRSPP